MADETSKQLGPKFLTTEKEGRLTVLNCRTPWEAFLVAEELEAADILVVLPNEEELFKEFQTYGFVSVRVSTQSYEAAKELQTVIERKHWNERTEMPLSIPMILTAIGLGLAPVPGFIFLFILNHAHKTKGYRRKAKSFRRWFFVGFALFYVLFVAFSRHL